MTHDNALLKKFLDLPSSSLLGDLDSEERTILSNRGEFLGIPPGTPLIEQGMQQPYLYLVLDGILDVYVSNGGNNIKVAEISPGDSIGEMSMIDQDTASATVVSRENCELWRMRHENLIDCWNDSPRIVAVILLALFAMATRRLKELNPKVAALDDSAKKKKLSEQAEALRQRRLALARRLVNERSQ